jgi:hypothetical protein
MTSIDWRVISERFLNGDALFRLYGSWGWAAMFIAEMTAMMEYTVSAAGHGVLLCAGGPDRGHFLFPLGVSLELSD